MGSILNYIIDAKVVIYTYMPVVTTPGVVALGLLIITLKELVNVNS
jgi:hypothetical protein